MAPEGVEVLAQRRRRLRIDLVDATRTRRSVEHQAHLLEHLEMLRHGGTAYRELSGELPDRERAPAQPLEDLTPGWISKRLQCPLLVSVHEQSIYTYRRRTVKSGSVAVVLAGPANMIQSW